MKLHPSNELTMLSHQVGALRRYLIKQRISLPAPGYHLDITAETADKTRAFLAELPGHCHTLQAALHDFQQRTSPDHFREASDFLRKIGHDPSLLFRMPTLEIHQSLRADAELLAAIGIDPALLNEMEPTLC